MEYFVFSGCVLAFAMSMSQILRSIRVRNMLLFSFFLCIGFVQIFIFLIISNKLQYYTWAFPLQIPLFFIVAPLLYMYFIIIITDSFHPSRLYLHFLPSVFSVILILPKIMAEPSTKQKLIREMFSGSQFNQIHFLTIVAGLFFFAYLLALFIKYPHLWKAESIYHKKTLPVTLLYIAAILCSLLVIVTILMKSLLFFKINALLITATIYAIYLMGQRYPFLLQHLSIPPKNGRQNESSHLKNINESALEKQLFDLMKIDQLFCNENLTLADLAEAVSVTPHQLSQFLNNKLNKSFNQYINKFRIKKACQHLLNDDDQSVITIGYSVGFNSTSAFYKAFQDIQKTSPAKFRKKAS